MQLRAPLGGASVVGEVITPMCLVVTWRGLLTAAFWVAGAAVAVAHALYMHNLSAAAAVLSIIAATLTIRGCINRHAANWEAAYGAGREVAKVRHMR